MLMGQGDITNLFKDNFNRHFTVGMKTGIFKIHCIFAFCAHSNICLFPACLMRNLELDLFLCMYPFGSHLVQI